MSNRNADLKRLHAQMIMGLVGRTISEVTWQAPEDVPEYWHESPIVLVLDKGTKREAHLFVDGDVEGNQPGALTLVGPLTDGQSDGERTYCPCPVEWLKD